MKKIIISAFILCVGVSITQAAGTQSAISPNGECRTYLNQSYIPADWRHISDCNNKETNKKSIKRTVSALPNYASRSRYVKTAPTTKKETNYLEKITAASKQKQINLKYLEAQQSVLLAYGGLVKVVQPKDSLVIAKESFLKLPLEALEELYAGIALACKKFGVDLVGGDTTSSQKGMLISITALGEAKESAITYRSGAKPNDLLVVSGDLGGAYMGLQVLEREKEVFKVNPNNQPDLEPYSYIVERQLKPEARKDIPELLKVLKVQPTAMIDISDGLSSEILHLCKESGVGCNLFEDKIPLDPTVIAACEEFNMDSTLVALSGGEDYELLFTLDQKDFDKIKGNPHLTVIGHMTDASEGAHLVTRSDTKIPLTAQGWNSFED